MPKPRQDKEFLDQKSKMRGAAKRKRLAVAAFEQSVAKARLERSKTTQA